jgi:hypothetical protein
LLLWECSSRNVRSHNSEGKSGIKLDGPHFDGSLVMPRDMLGDLFN